MKRFKSRGTETGGGGWAEAESKRGRDTEEGERPREKGQVFREGQTDIQT